MAKRSLLSKRPSISIKLSIASRRINYHLYVEMLGTEKVLHQEELIIICMWRCLELKNIC